MPPRLLLTGRAIITLGACLVPLLAGAGCSGHDRHDHHTPPSPFPRYHHVTIILNVSDRAGDALGQVNVWVDGVLQPERTSDEFVTLGPGYPESWHGFQANWIKGGFTVATYDYGDVASITVTVSRPGFYSQATEFGISDAQPAEVFARDTFIMEPAPLSASAGDREPRMNKTPGEVIGRAEKSGEAHGPPVFKVAAGRPATNKTLTSTG